MEDNVMQALASVPVETMWWFVLYFWNYVHAFTYPPYLQVFQLFTPLHGHISPWSHGCAGSMGKPEILGASQLPNSIMQELDTVRLIKTLILFRFTHF
jgi:hypothetical protein